MAPRIAFFFLVAFVFVQASLAASRVTRDAPEAEEKSKFDEIKDNIEKFIQENKIDKFFEDAKNTLKTHGETLVTGAKDLANKIKDNFTPEETKKE